MWNSEQNHKLTDQDVIDRLDIGEQKNYDSFVHSIIKPVKKTEESWQLCSLQHQSCQKNKGIMTALFTPLSKLSKKRRNHDSFVYSTIKAVKKTKESWQLCILQHQTCQENREIMTALCTPPSKLSRKQRNHDSFVLSTIKPVKKPWNHNSFVHFIIKNVKIVRDSWFRWENRNHHSEQS